MNARAHQPLEQRDGFGEADGRGSKARGEPRQGKEQRDRLVVADAAERDERAEDLHRAYRTACTPREPGVHSA